MHQTSNLRTFHNYERPISRDVRISEVVYCIAIAALMSWSVIGLGEVTLGNPGPRHELRPNGEVSSELLLFSHEADVGIVIIAMISWSIVGLEEAYSVL